MKGLDVQYQPTANDAYLEHLAASQERFGAVAANDIFNAQGALLVRKGSALTQHTVARLQQQPLAQTVDEIVALQQTLSAAELLAAIETMLKAHPDLAAVHATQQFADRLRHFCYVRSLPHSLMNRLTVMQARLPEVFERSLFGAWFASLLAVELKLPPALQYSAFIAGLFHDLGLVHLPADLVSKRHHLTEQEWLQLHRHVELGAQLVQKPALYDSDAIQAIVEHHERCDGSGYPRGLDETRLGILGQLVGLADTLHDMLFIQFAGSNRHLRDALAYLQLNSRRHFYATFQASVALIKRAQLSNDSCPADLPAAVRDLRNQSQHAGQHLQQLSELIAELPTSKAGSHADKAATALLRTVETVRSSGLFSTDLDRWLQSIEQAAPSAEICQELRELDDICYEAHWQMRHLCRQLRRVLEQELVRTSDKAAAMEQKLSEIEQALGQSRHATSPDSPSTPSNAA